MTEVGEHAASCLGSGNTQLQLFSVEDERQAGGQGRLRGALTAFHDCWLFLG